MYLNGIADHSELIMARVAAGDSRIRVKNCDQYNSASFGEFDYLLSKDFLRDNPMQARVFAHSYVELTKEGFDYILYLDLDEYLTPRTGSYTLHDLIHDYSDPDFIKFKWFNACGSSEQFLAPVREVVEGDSSQVTKCMIKCGLSNVKFQNTHLILTDSPKRRCLSGLGVISNYTKDEVDEVFDESFVLIHQLYRSPMEYCAQLFRGDFIYSSMLGLKSNRGGWLSSGSEKVTVASEVVDAFRSDCDCFIMKHNVKDLLVVAKHLVKVRANQMKMRVSEFKKENSVVDRLLDGIEID